MNEKNRAKIEARLQEERERAVRSLERYEEAAAIGTDEDGDITRYPLHPADEGTDTIQQETALSLLSQDSERLALIDDALMRLMKEPDAFGVCENCGKDIPMERLDIVPWTRRCMDCGEAP